jgi:hypothetical protein
MPDAAWKAFERRVAKLFPNGRRRGADTRSETGGKSDIVCDGWAPECKLLSRPSFSALLDAAHQAERNAQALQVPVAIVKRKRDRDHDALVVMRLETFRKWFLARAVLGDQTVNRETAITHLGHQRNE